MRIISSLAPFSCWFLFLFFLCQFPFQIGGVKKGKSVVPNNGAEIMRPSLMALTTEPEENAMPGKQTEISLAIRDGRIEKERRKNKGGSSKKKMEVDREEEGEAEGMEIEGEMEVDNEEEDGGAAARLLINQPMLAKHLVAGRRHSSRLRQKIHKNGLLNQRN